LSAISSPSRVKSYVSPLRIPETVIICSVSVMSSAPLKLYVWTVPVDSSPPLVLVYRIIPLVISSLNVKCTFTPSIFTFVDAFGVTVPNVGATLSYIIPVLVTIFAALPDISVPSMDNSYVQPFTRIVDTSTLCPPAFNLPPLIE